MELCIKTDVRSDIKDMSVRVSILVLMELCIKTIDLDEKKEEVLDCFNPCFNGTMYKNIPASDYRIWTEKFQSLF